MLTEKNLQAFFIKEAKKLGCVVGKVEMTGKKGFPDVFCRTWKSTLLIEFKHPNGKGKLSKHQVVMTGRLRELGAAVLVLSSKANAQSVLDSIAIGNV